ncbi:hypothetical protein ZIOFF_064452 [Zingiber officinale]|uniref:Protein EARLY FLOWERING 4 domain-containing protein n=1 Tax=Zingiber officinale TaxID=94328 RepID=A0A8J5EW05_ZINOF|nr:hypothetical protein ZIOFF_064452 [Zingiber officinale]
MEGDSFSGFGNGSQVDGKVFATFQKSFLQVQSILDQNRLLINEINQNHESKIPDNLTRNVSLIRELNNNIRRVVDLYADLSLSFTRHLLISVQTQPVQKQFYIAHEHLHEGSNQFGPYRPYQKCLDDESYINAYLLIQRCLADTSHSLSSWLFQATYYRLNHLFLRCQVASTDDPYLIEGFTLYGEGCARSVVLNKIVMWRYSLYGVQRTCMHKWIRSWWKTQLPVESIIEEDNNSANSLDEELDKRLEIAISQMQTNSNATVSLSRTLVCEDGKR